jgi:hypothetical protein
VPLNMSAVTSTGGMTLEIANGISKCDAYNTALHVEKSFELVIETSQNSNTPMYLQCIKIRTTSMLIAGHLCMATYCAF